jgi:hypothetical protein
MITFLKVLFFGSWVSITSNPVNIGRDALNFYLVERPISAITPGAHLIIDISANISQTNILARISEVEEFMPPGCLVAKFTGIDGSLHLLTEVSGSADNKKTYLNLSKEGGIETDLEFTEISITSCKAVKNINIIWSNFKK